MSISESELLYACRYAIGRVLGRGSVEFIRNCDGEWHRTRWLDIVDEIDNRLSEIETEGGKGMSEPVKDYPKSRKKQTNADKIRQMTDEELAKIICCQDSRQGDECIDTPCTECILDWLKQGVNENGTQT